MDASTYVAILAGVAISQIIERVGKLIKDVLADRRREIAERRKAVLAATIALVTAKQTTGKDYLAGDVSELFSRLAYLMENDGSAWDRARYEAEGKGKAFEGLPPEEEK